MTTRIASLASFALVAACGSSGGSTDIQPTLTFADRTDAEINRLVTAASGSEGFQAQASVASLEPSTTTDPCPAVAISGKTVTITGGCTTQNSIAIEGSATITNPLGWEGIEYDYTSDSTYELHGLAFVQSGIRRSFDGIFVIGSSYSELDMDITADQLGVAVRSDIYMDCSTSGCSIGNSGVELVGVGGARVSGSISVSQTSTSSTFTLKGTDTVKVTVANNCVSWKLEGTDRAFDPCAR